MLQVLEKEINKKIEHEVGMKATSVEAKSFKVVSAANAKDKKGDKAGGKKK